MVDLDAIRAALAAATPGPWSQHVLNFVETGDCPSCEIDYSAAFGFIVVRPHLSDDGADGVNDAHLVANAPTWLAALCDEIERLRADTQELNAGWTECAVERDAALADLKTQAESWDKDIQTARAWRACADQLAARVRFESQWWPLNDATGEALAEYKRLKGAQ